MSAIIDTVDLKPILKALLDEVACRDSKLQEVFKWFMIEYEPDISSYVEGNEYLKDDIINNIINIDLVDNYVGEDLL